MLGSVLLQAAGPAHESFLQFLGENLELFLTYTGVYNATPGHLIMILVGLLFIFLVTFRSKMQDCRWVFTNKVLC